MASVFTPYMSSGDTAKILQISYKGDTYGVMVPMLESYIGCRIRVAMLYWAEQIIKEAAFVILGKAGKNYCASFPAFIRTYYFPFALSISLALSIILG